VKDLTRKGEVMMKGNGFAFYEHGIWLLQ